MYPHSIQTNPIFKKASKSDKAVLLIHGFTSSPDIMRPVLNHLHEQGYTVYAPLLAGHGTTNENLKNSTKDDWLESAKQAYLKLSQDYQKISVVGLSLGGLLTLQLAILYPAIKSICCLATPLVLESWIHTLMPIINHTPIKYLYQYQKKLGLDIKDKTQIKQIWSNSKIPIQGVSQIIDLQNQIKPNLWNITQPTLIIHSRYDKTAPYENLNLIAKGVSSQITETATLENSYHLLTMDYDRNFVCDKILDFFNKTIKK